MFKTIIMATDGSPAVERLIVYTEHMARRTDAQVIVVHAYEFPSVYDWTDAYEILCEHHRKAVVEVAEDAVDALQQAGVQAVADVREGPAAQCIVEAARVHQADLIIMGCRAQKSDPMADALLGSVSSAVLRNSYCPTLLIP
ncbi:MAG: universal stress protein [Caldilineaceae bacterium]|jgi:nucleotide-binding universal stress UspA family protein